jgi:2-polyprenyl-3-methyl-5-hydroxy-6-metoxy-1,4-benzoquinol methylase
MDHWDWLEGATEHLKIVSNVDRSGKPLKTLVNIQTGLVRSDPIPTDEELARFYSENYRVEYKGAELPRKRQALRNFRRVAEFVRDNSDIMNKAGRVLDVGAGSGEFLFIMKELGKDGRGIEPNRAYSQFCRDAYQLNVQTAHLRADLFDSGGYDFVRLNHVLEHLNDPVKYLEMMAHWMKDDGVLYVEVPNIEEYCRTKSRGRLFHYGHIYNFTPWTLRAVAAMAGLEEIPATAQKQANTTGVFLRKGVKVAPQTLVNPESGARICELIRQHVADGPRVSRRSKLTAKLAARLDETWSTLWTNSYSEIGRSVAASLAR